MKALTMKVQFTWDRVFLAVLVKDCDFGGMAFYPLKIQALKPCECLKLIRKIEQGISRELLFFFLHAIIVLELYYSLWLSCAMCCT